MSVQSKQCTERKQSIKLPLAHMSYLCTVLGVMLFLVLSPLQRLAGATLLVFANKQDLPGALSKEAIREVRLTLWHHHSSFTLQWISSLIKLSFFSQALALDEIKSHHWCIIGCSAVTGENLLVGVDWLLDDIAARIFTAD